ncbi:unnamed protein product, partial [marine sediment metagenome]
MIKLTKVTPLLLALVFTSSDSSRSLPVGIYSFSGPLATEYGMQ